MFIFKILLILLIAAPVIALGTYFYMQILTYIGAKNKLEKEAIERSLGNVRRKSGKSSKRKRKKKEKRESEDRI